MRLVPVTREPRMRPSLISGMAVAIGTIATSTSPAITAALIWASPRNGTGENVDAGRVLEHFHGQMQRVADAARAVIELARLGAGARDQVLDRADARFRACHQHQSRTGDLGDGREILLSVERQAFVKRRRDRGAGGVLQDRVAVGRGLGDRIGAKDAAGAGFVFDDHRLADLLRQLHAHEAGQHVDRAARRERHDQADGAVGIALRRGRFGGDGGDRDRKHQVKPSHDSPRHPEVRADAFASTKQTESAPCVTRGDGSKVSLSL